VDQALSPFVEMGRASYPEARERFFCGLPEGYRFYVRTEQFDFRGRSKSVFVLVDSIDDGVIRGVIANNVSLAPNQARGDAIALPEQELTDWAIVAPDGSAEGNFVGRFLVNYWPGRRFGVVFSFSISESGQAQNIRLYRVVSDTPRPINLDLPPSWIEAAMRKIADEQEQLRIGRHEAPHIVFVPFVYDPDRPEKVITLEELSVTA
jgi:hypothetical protein